MAHVRKGEFCGILEEKSILIVKPIKLIFMRLCIYIMLLFS